VILSLSGPSFPTVVGSMGVSLTYNSLDDTTDTQANGLGKGWTITGGDDSHPVPSKLIDHNARHEYDAAEIVYPDGSSQYYNHVGSSNVYRSDPDDQSVLKKTGGGWTFVYPDGSLYTFGTADTDGTALVTGAELVSAQPGQGKLTYTFSTGATKLLTQLVDGAGRTLDLTWHALNAGGCADAIVCVKGPDNVTWKLIGNTGGGTGGHLVKLNDGTRDLYQLTYDANDKLQKIQNANDLNAAAASPGYDSTHSVQISYDGSGRATSVVEGPITGQTPSSSTWSFVYHPGSVQTNVTRAAHDGLAAGSTRQAAGYTEITPPRQQGQPSPKKTTVYYDDLDHPLETIDLLGHVSESGYDRKDHLTWTEDQDGNPTDYSYDPASYALLSKTDPDPDGNGALPRPVTSYRYDETAIGTASSAGPILHGLQAEYYTNAGFTGRAAAQQTDPQVDFNWGTTSPAVLGAHTDNYSVRWTGILTTAGEGDYTLALVSDGNSRLVVDDTQAVNDYQTHAAMTVSSAPVHLTAGSHRLVLEYTETTGTAQIQLRYSCPACSPALADQVITSSALTPNWQNRTSTISPAGRLSYSHYQAPWTGKPDYTEQLLDDGTPVITTYAYDSYGRTAQTISPRGNATLVVTGAGTLNGNADTAYATTYTYYGLAETAAPPQFCGGGGTVNQAGQLKQTTPPATAATSYVYDAAGRQVAKTDGAGTTCTSWSSEGRKTAVTDANNHTTSYTYDPAGAVRTVTAADTTVTTTAYDESGAVTARTDGNNHTTTYGHDAEGNRTTVTDPLGHTTTTAYDELGRRTSVTDPLNHTTTYAYDNEGRLTTTTTPLGNTTTTTYDTLGRVAAGTDPNGRTTSFGYDADGNQTTVTDPLNHTTTTAYDAHGRVSSTTDANNHTTHYAYDLDGNQTAVTAPDNAVTTTAYDAAGRKTSVTDPLNHVTAYAYDAAGRLTTTTLPTGETTGTGFDPVGNPITATDAAGQTTHLTYDAVNRKISETTPLGETTSISYDNAGNKASVTDPLGHTTSYAYDAADRLTTTTDALTHTVTLAYDNADRLTSKTDQNGHTTSYGYDNDGNRTSVTGPDTSSTTLTYDDAGNLLTRTDDNNHTTTYTYDANNRLASKTDPLAHQWTYSYDPVGNKTQVVDGNGNATTSDPNDGKTTYTYDTNDRLTGIDYSDSTPDVSFTYDSAGRKTSMTDGAGTQGYGYDNSDRLTSVTRGGTGFAYSYDTAGRLASRTYPDSTVTTYGYDNDGRLATVTVGSNTTGYTYDAAGRITAVAYPNGWTEQRSYDNADRLSDIRSVKTGSSNLAVATYTRDNAGNPTTIVRDGVTETYTYDTADRVTAACYGGQVATCATGSKIAYTYDKVGNRTSQTKFGTTTSYSYDAADELCWSGPTAGSSCGTVPTGDTAYSYDNDGQQTGQGTKTFTYDLAGQLTAVANSGTTLASFTYDGAGNRLTKTASSVTTSYAWDENNDLPMLATEKQGSTVLRDYAYGDQLLTMLAAGSAYYYHHDTLGTTAAITKQTGATEWTYTYTPYGEPRQTTKVDSAAPDNPIQYTSELTDAETGLYDLRARTYNPADGRFFSSDPLAQDVGAPSVSVYLYANAAPLVLADPSGKRVCLDFNCWTGAPPAPPPSASPPSPSTSDNDTSAGSGGGGGHGNAAKRGDAHPASSASATSPTDAQNNPSDSSEWETLKDGFVGYYAYSLDISTPPGVDVSMNRDGTIVLMFGKAMMVLDSDAVRDLVSWAGRANQDLIEHPSAKRPFEDRGIGDSTLLGHAIVGAEIGSGSTQTATTFHFSKPREGEYQFTANITVGGVSFKLRLTALATSTNHGDPNNKEFKYEAGIAAATPGRYFVQPSCKCPGDPGFGIPPRP
jgi:RHS repeat-associated protein